MEINRPALTRRNIIYAAVLGLLASCYWLIAWQLRIEIQQAVPSGFDGEVNGILVLLFFIIAAYTSLFFLATFLAPIRRASKPTNKTVFILGLLPTVLLFLLTVVSMLRQSVE